MFGVAPANTVTVGDITQEDINRGILTGGINQGGLGRIPWCMIYAEFENIIEIDRNRNIVFDFNN